MEMQVDNAKKKSCRQTPNCKICIPSGQPFIIPGQASLRSEGSKLEFCQNRELTGVIAYSVGYLFFFFFLFACHFSRQTRMTIRLIWSHVWHQDSRGSESTRRKQGIVRLFSFLFSFLPFAVRLSTCAWRGNEVLMARFIISKEGRSVAWVTAVDVFAVVVESRIALAYLSNMSHWTCLMRAVPGFRILKRVIVIVTYEIYINNCHCW